MSLCLTLLADGPSDRALLPIILWAAQAHTDRSIEPQLADLRQLPTPPKRLPQKVDQALAYWPCDLLCVHRDAENQDPSLRYDEIADAVGERPYVPIVPVRMHEAWLLHDEAAIRHAAGRPRGTEPLTLPRMARVEADPDPKATLHAALRSAHAASGRRARRFAVQRAANDVAEHITDWTPLRALPAFQRFERDLRAALIRLEAAPRRR